MTQNVEKKDLDQLGKNKLLTKKLYILLKRPTIGKFPLVDLFNFYKT